MVRSALMSICLAFMLTGSLGVAIPNISVEVPALPTLMDDRTQDLVPVEAKASEVVARAPGKILSFGSELVLHQSFNELGRLETESGILLGQGISFERNYVVEDPSDAKEKCTEKKQEQGHHHCDPDHGNNGCNGKGGCDIGNETTDPGNGTEDPDPVDPDPFTDCAATQFSHADWHWTQPYSAQAQLFPEVFQTAGETWQAHTNASIFDTISLGYTSSAGVLDGSNQIDFNLMQEDLIAVTSTWYYTSSGIAVESDATYNWRYAWTTIENPVGMDLPSIATHELGHTFGMKHASGEGSDCLTMYATEEVGNSHKRTLGDGDILGLQAKYESVQPFL